MSDAGIGSINLKVLIFDTDYYALQAMTSYLAWDRRTRVKALCETPEEMWSYISRTPLAEQPDVIIFDADHVGGAHALQDILTRLRSSLPHVILICMSSHPETTLIEAAANAGARGFMLKHDVRLRLAWALVYTLAQEFVITSGVARIASGMFNSRVFHAVLLPEQREYPELTDRIRQAIKLCVVEGMPAHLAADEMGISLHTIRGYIKEGYRILEAYDETEYPVDMTPQERAFMRFTALEDDAPARQ
ncbi:MAG: response regulator transcription factor [Chloroflexi bacterium]|nr:response regulator transcription factor [Chloroflexota bacterium]